MRLSFMIANEDIPEGAKVTGLTGVMEKNLKELKKAGFKSFELMIADPEKINTEKIRSLERQTETEISFLCTGEMAGTMGLYLNHIDSKKRQEALSGLLKAVEKASKLGVNINIGRLRGIVWEDGLEHSLKRLEEALQIVDNFVSSNLLRLSILIEPLRRDICPILNSCSQTYDFILSAGLRNFGILLDSDHFDRGSDSEFLASHIDTIMHVHLADTMHKPLGHGEVDFDRLLNILFDAGYAGDFSVEIFTGSEQYSTLSESATFLRKYSRLREVLA